MFTHFKLALDDVKAEPNRVTRTERFLQAELAPERTRRPHSAARQLLPSLRVVAAVCGICLFMVAGSLGAYRYYWTPAAYLSMDINPGVEMSVNPFGRVISAAGLNADGQEVLEGLDWQHRPLAEALNLVVISAIEKDYIAADGTTVILLTAASDDSTLADRLGTDAEAAVRAALRERNRQARLMRETASLEEREQARSLGISAGRLIMIERLMEVNSEVTVENCQNSSIRDLVDAIEQAQKGPAVTNAPEQNENAPSGLNNESEENGINGMNGTNGPNDPNGTNDSAVNGPAENSSTGQPGNLPGGPGNADTDSTPDTAGPQNTVIPQNTVSPGQDSSSGQDNNGPANQSDQSGNSNSSDVDSGNTDNSATSNSTTGNSNSASNTTGNSNGSDSSPVDANSNGHNRHNPD